MSGVKKELNWKKRKYFKLIFNFLQQKFAARNYLTLELRKPGNTDVWCVFSLPLVGGMQLLIHQAGRGVQSLDYSVDHNTL